MPYIKFEHLEIAKALEPNIGEIQHLSPQGKTEFAITEYVLKMANHPTKYNPKQKGRPGQILLSMPIEHVKFFRCTQFALSKKKKTYLHISNQTDKTIKKSW